MAGLTLTRRRRWQPSNARLAASPLARGLVRAHLTDGAGTWRELVNGWAMTPGSTDRNYALSGAFGKAAAQWATDPVTTANGDLGINNAVTLTVVVTCGTFDRGNTAAITMLYGDENGLGVETFTRFGDGGISADQVQFNIDATKLNSATHFNAGQTYVITFRSTPAGMQIWIDGRLDASNATNTGTGGIRGQAVSMNVSSANVGSRNGIHGIHVAYWHTRSIGDDEIQQLAADPFCLLAWDSPLDYALLAAQPAGGGGSPQTTTAQIGALALTGIAGTSTPGAVAKVAQIGALALSGIAGTSTFGNVTRTAQIGSLALSALAGTSTGGPASSTAQIGTITLVGVAGSSSAGASPQTTTAQIGAIALTGIVGTSVPGSVSTTGQIANLALSAIPGSSSTVGTPQTTTAQIGALTLSGVAGTSTGGPVTRASQVATLALTGVQGVSTSGTTTIGQAATLTLTGVPGTSTGGPSSTTAQVATLTLNGISGTSIPGPVSKTAQVATITLAAVPGTSTAGGQTTTAQVAILTLTALPGGSVKGTATTTAQIGLITLTGVPNPAGAYDPFPEHVTVAQRSRVTIEQTSRYLIGT